MLHRGRERRGVFLSGTALADRRARLHQLLQRRADVLTELEALLASKELAAQQAAKLAHAQLQLQAARQAAAGAQGELARMQQRLEELRLSNVARQAAITSSAAQLSTAQLSVAPLVLPQELRTHEMAALHASLSLLAEQRAKVAQLMDVLPLRVEGLRSPAPQQSAGNAASPLMGGTPTLSGQFSLPPDSSPMKLVTRESGCGAGVDGIVISPPTPGAAPDGGNVLISLCGHRLPNTLAGGLSAPQAQALSAVLGYALLLLELAASYLGGPLLHEGSFQGSTSVVWQQQSFWNRRPAGSPAVLPLFMEPGLVSSAVAPLSLSAKSSSSGSSGWALPLVRAMAASVAPSGGGASASPAGQGAEGSSGGAAGPGTESALERKHADFKLAFEMLQRSSLAMARQCALNMQHTRGRGVGRPNGEPGGGHAWGSPPPLSLGPGGLEGKQGGGKGGGVACSSAWTGSRAGAAAGGIPLPHSWGAWGCLVALCAAVLQDDNGEPWARGGAASKMGGVLPAAALAVQAESMGAGGAAWSGVPTAPPTGWGADGDDAADGVGDEDGWDVLHSVLPPPPSSDDVEQYARALFSDGNASTLAGSLQGSGQHHHQHVGPVNTRNAGAGVPLNSGLSLSPSGGPGASPLGLARLGSLLRGAAGAGGGRAGGGPGGAG